MNVPIRLRGSYPETTTWTTTSPTIRWRWWFRKSETLDSEKSRYLSTTPTRRNDWSKLSVCLKTHFHWTKNILWNFMIGRIRLSVSKKAFSLDKTILLTPHADTSASWWRSSSSLSSSSWMTETSQSRWTCLTLAVLWWFHRMIHHMYIVHKIDARTREAPGVATTVHYGVIWQTNPGNTRNLPLCLQTDLVVWEKCDWRLQQ